MAPALALLVGTSVGGTCFSALARGKAVQSSPSLVSLWGLLRAMQALPVCAAARLLCTHVAGVLAARTSLLLLAVCRACGRRALPSGYCHAFCCASLHWGACSQQAWPDRTAGLPVSAVQAVRCCYPTSTRPACVFLGQELDSRLL